jgi:hypothetical protein
MDQAIIQQYQALVAAGKNADEIRAILIGEGVSEQNVTSLLNPSAATPIPPPVVAAAPLVPPVAAVAPPSPNPPVQAAPNQASASSTLPDHIVITKDPGMKRENLRTFHITDGSQVFYVVNLTNNRYRIDIYHDEAKTSLAFSLDSKSFKEKMANKYEILDAGGTVLGAIQSKAFESMVTEHWDILDAAGNQIGSVEQAVASAMLGRFMPGTEQSYTATVNGQVMCSYQLANQAGAMGTMASFGFGLPQLNMDIHYSPNVTDGLTRLLGLAAGVLLGTEFGARR